MVQLSLIVFFFWCTIVKGKSFTFPMMNTVFLALTRNNGRSKLQKSLIDNMININHYNGKIMENMNHIIIICNCLMKRTLLLGKNTGWTPVVCGKLIIIYIVILVWFYIVKKIFTQRTVSEQKK